MIEQLIAESKKRKAENQRAREQTIELTEKLDTEWKDLLPIVSSSKTSASNVVDDKEKPDSYDTVMRQLKFEARGKVWCWYAVIATSQHLGLHPSLCMPQITVLSLGTSLLKRQR